MPFNNASRAERRLSLRLLAYWERLRRGEPMAERSHFDAHDIDDLWDDCFLLSISDGRTQAEHIGSNIKQSLVSFLETDDPLALDQENGLETMLQSPKPMLHEGELTSRSGRPVRYRLCMLPLGENGTITAILGTAGLKQF